MRKQGSTVEFRLGASLLRKSHMNTGIAIVLGLVLLSMVMMIVAAGAIHPEGIAGALAAAWEAKDENESLFKNLRWLLVFLVAGLALLWMQRACCLRLTDVGIEANIPKWLGMGLHGLTTGRWKVDWKSVRSIRLVSGNKPRLKPALQLGKYRLIVETGRETIHLSPFPWFLPGGPDHRLGIREVQSTRKFDAAQAIERSPLVQALRARGFELSPEPIAFEKAPTGYDLTKHPGMVAQLVLFFAAAAYAVLDGLFVQAFLALEPLPAAPFLMATVVGAVIAFIAGTGAPPAERWVVGGLMVVALTAAVYPGLLRFNAMTAEPQEIVYRAVGPGQFESSVEGYPELDLRKLKVNEYWAEYPEGAEHEFLLMRGSAGFYQVDMRPVHERTRDFYSKLDNND